MTRPLYTITTTDASPEVVREFSSLDEAAAYAATLTRQGVGHTVTKHVGAAFLNWTDTVLAE